MIQRWSRVRDAIPFVIDFKPNQDSSRVRRNLPRLPGSRTPTTNVLNKTHCFPYQITYLFLRPKQIIAGVPSPCLFHYYFLEIHYGY
jgi:hypothetical protein